MMKTLKIFIILLFAAGITKSQSTQLTKLPDTFQNVLNLGKMTFEMPKGSISVPLVKNMQMHYEYAVTFKDKPIEIRYSVAPFGYTVDEAYNGGKGVEPHKSKMEDDEFGSKVTSTVVAMNVAGGTASPGMSSKPYAPEAVKKEFGADWGSTTIIPIANSSFGTAYKFCMMITLFKKGAGDAYIFYLGNDRESLIRAITENIINTGAFYALKFK